MGVFLDYDPNHKKYILNDEENITITFANFIQFKDKEKFKDVLNGTIIKIDKYYGITNTYYNNKNIRFFIRKEDLPREILWILHKDLKVKYKDLNVKFEINDK